MPTLADRIITALRTEHDRLAARVAGLDAEQLRGPSAASEWTVAQVLSHLGSGAEITLAGLQAALGERDRPGEDFNPSVWDRWNALAPEEQRDGFLAHDAVLVEALEGLGDQQRRDLEVPIGFLPHPLSTAAFGGMRLNEAALHAWDVHVAFDTSATLDDAATGSLAELLAGELGFLLGFLGKTDRVDAPVVVRVSDSGYGLAITDGVALVTPIEGADAEFTGALEAALRLVSGRLTPAYTPAGVTVTGAVTLDELRRVFPGF